MQTNERGALVRYFPGEYKTLDDFKKVEDLPCHKHLGKNIPQLTDVEFHTTEVVHVTTKSGLGGVFDSGGFNAGKDDLLWWSLAIDQEAISAAENRYLERRFPHRTEEQLRIQKPFLKSFTTSPVFSEASRYGNFKFTLSLRDLLQMYREQFCSGGEVVMSLYRTSVYKQEVMYTVLVHSSLRTCDKCPRLDDLGDSVGCMYKDGTIIWRAQWLCATHEYEPVEKRPQVIDVVPFSPPTVFDKWYIWDHVTFAFSLLKGQTFQVDRKRLIQSLAACDTANLFLGSKCSQDIRTCNCGLCRVPLPEAEWIVHKIKQEGEVVVIVDFIIKQESFSSVSPRFPWVHSFPTARVLDIDSQLPCLVANGSITHATTVVVHVGRNNIFSQQSEVLKKHFVILLATLKQTPCKKVVISGPLPCYNHKDIIWSRLNSFNGWLKRHCKSEGICYVENFELFLNRSDLFERDGLHPNRSGARVLLENIG